MKREEFKDQYIVDVKIRIADREQCYEFQRIAFEFGVRVHSSMNRVKQSPITYNISDTLPEYKGKSFATDMDSLVIYDNGTRLQKPAMYWLENDKKEITYNDFINAYKSIEPC